MKHIHEIYVQLYIYLCYQILNIDMGLNLPKYSKLIKFLCLIPILVGIMNITENFLPTKEIETSIVSKNTNYRVKFDKTTYNIDFEDNNDQFTQEIYNEFNISDKVVINVTYFTEETSSIRKLNSDKIFENSTGEIYFRILFGVVFLIPLFWVSKKQQLSANQCKYALILILISAISMIRLIF